MRFEAIEIDPYMGYGFLIETKEKPDRVLKERLRSQIETAMNALERDTGSYSVTVIKGSEDYPREGTIPNFSGGKEYILFALLSSGNPGESLSHRELEEIEEEVRQGILLPPKSRIALVTLQDATISVTSSDLRPRGAGAI